ncbi:pseudouridine synthase [Marinobacter sp.]|uniref:pseudouridine synthase n=1 Tax=Marinobacter sp. TaxID=50741 RepID=UPI003850DDB0
MPRLDFYLANSTGLSRSDARRQIRKGAVMVDGLPCRKPATHISPEQQVCWRGQTVHLPGERYIMLNKPAGVVSATEDRDHLTALSLLPPEEQTGLHIVGRLDLDTTGLLLLTTDGQWSHRITSPRSECPKVYRVELAGPLGQEARNQLETGVHLKDESLPTAPAMVRQAGPTTIELTITEGRYHQVKRMLAAAGNHVIGLHRLQIGEIRLDTALAPGEFRHLKDEEIASVE